MDEVRNLLLSALLHLAVYVDGRHGDAPGSSDHPKLKPKIQKEKNTGRWALH
jgi:hypothetical protein